MYAIPDAQPLSGTGTEYVIVDRGFDVMNETCGQDYLDTISLHIDSLSDDLRRVSLEIHDHPELQYKEHHAHKVLTQYMSQQQGWQVTPSAYNIETAFVAVYESGRKGPTVSFNAEYGTDPRVWHATQ